MRLEGTSGDRIRPDRVESDSFAVFGMQVSSPIRTNFAIEKDGILVMKLLLDSDFMQYKEPMNVRINNTDDLLKMFSGIENERKRIRMNL